MSTAVIRNLEKSPVDVIVKGHGSEPAHLRAVLIRPGVVEAVGSVEGLSMGFPEDDVYAFDATLFGQLQNAHRYGKQRELATLWAKAERFNPE